MTTSGSTGASRCTNLRHDHTTTIDGHGGTLDQPVPMRCGGCGLPAHYDEAIAGYQHDDPAAPACFQVRHQDDTNQCWLPIEPDLLTGAELRAAVTDLRGAWIAVHTRDSTGTLVAVHGRLVEVTRRLGQPADVDINLVVVTAHGDAVLLPAPPGRVASIQQIPVSTPLPDAPPATGEGGV
jgi:hypothetical protein